MPNSHHFDFGRSAGHNLLALPRPSSSPTPGCYVSLIAHAWGLSCVSSGPLGMGDVGIVLEDTGAAERPFLVQELVSGRLWWYPEAALQPVPADRAPEEHRVPLHPGEGSYVTLLHNYKSFSDAGRGPLSLQRTEDAYGMVLMESGQRVRVRSCHSSRDWWYDHGAVRAVHMQYVPESLRAAVRPGWGDYVALTHDHAAFGPAWDGPLEPGNLGVVVAVSDVPDSEGGLRLPRYCVRACHNGQSYRYHEGALHLVVQQLLHAPKIPPASGKGRRHKLRCQLQLTASGSGSAVGTGQVLSRGEVQQVHLVTPGTKYWIAAKLSCKDDDLMLANFKPCALELYAPSGRPGHYMHLKPVACTQQQQRQQAGHSLQQQGPELLSLAFCNGAAAAGGAAAASCVWYNPMDDEAFAVFEWDSSETPLALKSNRVTEVNFVWGVCFNGIAGQFTKKYTLHLQTAAHASSSRQQAAAEAAAARTAMQDARAAAAGTATPVNYSWDSPGGANDSDSDSSAHSVVLDWLDVGAAGAPTGAGRNRRRRTGNSSSSSSGSSSGSSDEEGESEGAAGSSDTDNNNGSSSSSEEEEQEEEEEVGDEQSAGSNADGQGGGDGNGSSGGRDSNGSSSNDAARGSGDGGAGFGGGGGGFNSSGGDEPFGTAPPTPPAGLSGSAAARDAAPGAAADVGVHQDRGIGCSSSSNSGGGCNSVGGSSSVPRSESAAGCSEPAGTASRAAGAEEASQLDTALIAGTAAAAAGASSGAAAACSSNNEDQQHRCPSTPDLSLERSSLTGLGQPSSSSSSAAGRSSSSSAGASSSSSAAGVSSSTSSGLGSSSRTSQQSLMRRGSSSSSSSSARDCIHRTARQDQQRSTSAGSFSGAGSSSSSSSSNTAGRLPPVSAPRAAAGAAAPAAFRQYNNSSAAAGSVGGSVNIQEVMRQVARQAESNEAMWQEGTELAAALAAKAMAAAEEWQKNWRRPGE